MALAVAVAAAVLLPSAGQGETPAAAPGPETDKPVIVFAAASMKTALDAVAAAWKTDSDKTASIAYASSAILAKQIAQGAPADIFISADLKWMDTLEKAELVRAETRRKLLGNKLVLIEPEDADTKLEIAKSFDLAEATGDGKSPSAPWTWVRRNLREGSTRIARGLRECRTKARASRHGPQCPDPRLRGEAKFGIVFATDAKADPKVKVVRTFPAPDRLSRCPRRGFGESRGGVFPELFDLAGSSQDLHGARFRYLAK